MQQPTRPPPRAPGSFSPLVPGSVGGGASSSSNNSTSNPNPNPNTNTNTNSNTNAAAAAHAATAAPSSRPMIRRIDTSTEETISLPKTRTPQTPVGLVSPTFPTNSPGRGSPQNFSRPNRAANDAPATRNASPLTLPPARAGHVRKHSQTPGLFEPSMPSMSMSNLSQVGMSMSMSMSMSQSSAAPSASQIAAQAAMQHQTHQQQQQQQQQQQTQQYQQQHSRHRSQTVPFPGSETHDPSKRPAPKPTLGPRSPPMLSLTEASAPRDNGFGSQGYHNGLLGSHAAAATAAANVVFPRTSSQNTSPVPPIQEHSAPPPPPLTIPEKPAKAEKSKVKLFSRPKKIDTKGESKERPMPSPGKIGSALASLQRGNYSTTSLADSQSFYNLGNSSAATIRATDSPIEREGKEKDKERKHHHFLSRQKHKLTSKDEHHLPLSSAASNSRPVDPSAPSSLYNFNPPPSPGPNSALGKSVSGLDLRHGGRALREKRKEEKLSDIMRHDNESVFGLASEWSGPGSLGSTANIGSNLHEPIDPAKYGLNGMSYDDAWPYLKAKLLVIFEGEDLRLPVEDLNKVVTIHIQYCIQRRAAHIIIDDLRDLLSTGFASLDHALRMTSEDRVIPALVELWVITFTNILPYLQAVFLPLDLEFSGVGPLLPADKAREFWGSVVAGGPVSSTLAGGNLQAQPSPTSSMLDVRRMVLTAYRDILILPRYEKLKTIFSRLSLEHLPYSLASLALASPPPVGDSIASLSTSPSDAGFAGARPGTAMSLDPSVASYNSTTTTVFGNDSNPSRSRAISNVSYASGASDPASASGGSLLRPFTPQTREILGSVREQNVEDSKQVTEMVGRLLQCMSVLASAGTGLGGGSLTGPGGADDPSKMVSELGRLLKLNWLGRGRTGRNRRGIVGGRVKRPDNRASGSALHEGILEGVGVTG
ncbi:HbrB-like-domain-containing protein [Nemania sp. FL0031]|nr:HbrB-like-domain-containing protein [Nemania sp. FL0031]